MASKNTRIKAKSKKGIVTVKAVARHAMLSGVEAKKAKTVQNYITYIKAEVDGKIVYEVNTSRFFSKNPYIKFQYRGEKGAKVVISWVDLLGNTNVSSGKVK